MRTKEKYRAAVKGRVHAEGRSIVIPISLDRDPDRPVVVTIPRSKIVPILRAAITAAEKIEPLNGYRPSA